MFSDVSAADPDRVFIEALADWGGVPHSAAFDPKGTATRATLADMRVLVSDYSGDKVAVCKLGAGWGPSNPLPLVTSTR